jgi:hypothetical protein
MKPIVVMLAVLATVLVGSSWGQGNPSAPQGASIMGEVLEVKDVDTYTYLRLKTKEGETWAAVGKASVKVGAEVTIENSVVMNDFESKTLKKKFDHIVFGNLAVAGASAAPPATNLGQIHGGFAQAPDVGSVKVAKANGPDARTVAEVVTKKVDLKDKPVTVRGKVVKFVPGVMGMNWIHLRDGSGSIAENTNDVVVTTKDETQVGAVVIAKGVVRTDVNLGSGYSYAVLIDDAKLQK